MFSAQSRREPWWPAYRTARDESLTSSTIASAAIVPPIVIALTAYMLSIEPATREVRFWLGGAYVLVCALYGVLWASGLLQRRAASLSLVFAMLVTGIAIVYWRYLPETAGGGIDTLLAIQMGGALVFPWGPYRQALMSIAIVAGYAWLVNAAPDTFQPYSAGLLVTTAPLMVYAAYLIDRYRSTAFARDWQKDQLVSLARELGAELDATRVGATSLEHAIRLIGADSGGVVLRMAERGVFRVEVTHGPDSSWLGQEFPDDFGLARLIGEAGVLILPRDDPSNPLLSVTAQSGTQHALYAAIREGLDVVGVLSISRGTDQPFKQADRGLARAVADQAGLALRTARLVHDLQLASQLKSEFVSTMSHELRTPLNVILGYAEVARDSDVASEVRDDCLSRIDGAARDLLELVESTLEIGKIESGAQDVRREAVALPQFWSRLGDSCRRLPRRPAVDLVWSTNVPPITVDTDPRKLTLVVRNLVGNALKFTEQGHVRVDLVARDDRLGVTVSDTGIGISPKDRATIFEMFRQADGSDTRRYGGVGLGLYIVRRTVDQLGGTIEVESTLGAGATFTMWLPCKESVPIVLSAVA